MSSILLDDLVHTHKQGQGRGIPSICSAHPKVLEATFMEANENNYPVLIESTCNQVNQYGGYTGMRPKDFVAYVHQIAQKFNFSSAQLILGGDHLGPAPWQGETASVAMEKSKDLIRSYILAGYRKIHVDASMRLGDDPPEPLSVELAAWRAAELVRIAEDTCQEIGERLLPRYVVGTEVPVPGGALGNEEKPKVTTVSDLEVTLEKTYAAFFAQDLASAWERTIAVVIQPGVEFGDASIHTYDSTATIELSKYIELKPQIFEAHSTDYQTQSALHQMVNDHFAILKVGPALTFAFREAIFALAMIENELLPPEQRSKLIKTLDHAMQENPIHWENHYHGDTIKLQLARKFSFSDRARYYWSNPEVWAAYQKLQNNFMDIEIPLSLLSQYFPHQYQLIRNKRLGNHASLLLEHKIRTVLQDYYQACQLDDLPDAI